MWKKCTKLLFALFLLGLSPTLADEVIVNFEEESVSVLNERLRKLQNDIDSNLGFVDRGDSSAVDWTQATLTTDGNWYDLDLSSIVPVHAKSVLMYVRVKDGSINQSIQFRKNGNSNSINRSVVMTQTVDQGIPVDVVCPIDTDRKIEYKTTNTTFTNIDIVVKGWWF